MLRNKLKKINIKKGFTLIELLVVIAIISLFSSIVYGSISVSRAKAQDTSIMITLRSIHQWMLGYYADTGQYPDARNCPDANGVTVPGYSCKICRDPIRTRWPPPTISAENNPFKKTIPSLHRYNGCIFFVTLSTPNQSNTIGYELWFHLNYLGEEELESKNAQLNAIFAPYSEIENPVVCEWLQDDVASCYIFYYHDANDF
jgi:prepilin-type N-terminal cleavage/methylation domain-containing protein